mmetsp:Transcript_29872/g.70234  ORF Transcript_29872/g.70234 Transcript_29872/m.70234 type:complete len:135 (-) Transcript_29872:63-467(-)
MKSPDGDPLRDRFKAIPRLMNPDDADLNGAQKRLIGSYNAKPLLTRPQHELVLTEDYAELDVDVHRFQYIARQGADTFRSKVKKMVFDLGFVVEGHDDSELPEQLLGCCRLSKLDLDGAKDFPIALEEDDSDGN